MPARTDNAEVKNRAWIVYPVVAVAATVVYYVLGHNSYLFNVIGLTSPVLILVAVQLHKPERRAPWFLIAAGQFLFGNVAIAVGVVRGLRRRQSVRWDPVR